MSSNIGIKFKSIKEHCKKKINKQTKGRNILLKVCAFLIWTCMLKKITLNTEANFFKEDKFMSAHYDSHPPKVLNSLKDSLFSENTDLKHYNKD